MNKTLLDILNREAEKYDAPHVEKLNLARALVKAINDGEIPKCSLNKEVNNFIKNNLPDANSILDLAIEIMETDTMEGICLACGETRECCEPDARNYECYVCGKDKVFGAQEILFMLS